MQNSQAMQSQQHDGEPTRDSDSQPPDGLSASAFDFVCKLAAELSTGRVELPSFPRVAIQVHRVLGRPDVTDDRVARVIACEAGLAARVLALANSAALSRGGRPILDLRQAVTRVGHQNTRSAAIAYSLGQLRMARQLRHIVDQLSSFWQHSTMVAALAHVVATHTRAADADEAMLAGLMHNIGGVYILARAEPGSLLFSDVATRDAIMRDWNAQIGRAIAENWGMSEAIAEAIAEQDVTMRPVSGRRDLLDVLSVAVRAACLRPGSDDAVLIVAGANTFGRLGIDGPAIEQLLAESSAEITDLRSALGQ